MDERQFPHDQQPTQQFPQQPPAPWGAPPAQDPGGWAPGGPVESGSPYLMAQQPAPQPVKARPRWKTPVIALVALVVGIAIGAAASGSKNTPSTTAGSTSTSSSAAAPAPGASASSVPALAAPASSAPAAAAPAKSTAAAPAPAVPATSVVLTASGNGIKTTKQFTVADNWSLKYSFDCSSFGSQGNFQVFEQGGDGDGSVLVNELSNKGGDVTYQHSDAGQHSLEVNSECSWTVTVTSGDAG